MPQKKDYDVYLGNQKVGEVWSHHDTKSEYEREMGFQKEVADLYFAKRESQAVKSTTAYQTKEARIKKNFKIRKIIGIIFMILAVGVPITTMLFFKNDMSEFTTFFLPAIIFGIGTGLTHTEATISADTLKARIDWASSLRWLIGGGIGFLIFSLLVLFALASIL